MNPTDNFTLPENADSYNISKEKKPSTLNEAKLELKIMQIELDYSIKTWNSVPESIKSFMTQSLQGKWAKESDEIHNVIKDIINSSSNPNDEIMLYLQKINSNKVKNSNEQNKIKVNENKTETKEVNKNLLTNARQLKQSLSNLNWTWKNYADVLAKIQSLEFNETGSQEQDEKFKKEIQEILTSLNNPATLFALSLDLKQADPQAYLDFQKSIISLDPSFEAKFIALEPKLQLALWNDNLNNSTINGNRITQKSPDGFSTTATLNGTQRTLSRSDSQFKLNSTLENDKEAQEAANKVERELNGRLEPITQELDNLEALRKDLETAQAQNRDLAEVKAEVQRDYLDLYIELWLEYLASVDELQRAVATKVDELTKEKEELKDKAKAYLNDLTSKHKQEVSEKQEIQKQVLNFLHEIGFDRIPQTFLDIIITNINANPEKHGLQTQIDLENGSLWFDTDLWSREISEGEKKKFIELYNKLLTWSKEFPVKLENWNITFHGSLEDAKANVSAGVMFDIGEFANRSLWGDPVFKAMENLGKEDEKE